MPVPDPEPFRLLKQYPLLCGLYIFSLKLRFKEMGVTFANAWGSILFTSHLYNAVRQERLLLKSWKDMELLIVMQSPERIFVGDRPNGLQNYLKRFLLGMGYSATAFASNRRRNVAMPSVRRARSLEELGEVGALFAGRYCNNDPEVAWTSESITPIIESKMDYDSDDEDFETDSSTQSKADSAQKKPTRVKQSATGALLKKPIRDKASIPTLDFLSDLANSLHAEALEVSIDYLGLHRSCWMLLRRVNEACKPKLLEMYGPGYLPKEHHLPFMIGYIFMTATNTSQVADLLLPRRGHGEVSSRLLQTAAECIEGMIDSGAGAVEIKMLEVTLGYEIRMDALDDADESS